MSEEKKKQKHIKDIGEGLPKTKKLIEKYDIKLVDIKDVSNVAPGTLAILKGEKKGNIDKIFDEIDGYTRTATQKKKYPSETTLSQISNDNYKSRLNTMNKLFKCDGDMKCLDNPEDVFKIFESKKTPVNSILSYVNTILGLIKYSSTFKKLLTNVDEYREIQQILIKRREKQLDDDISYKDVVSFKDLKEIQKEYEENEPYSFNHLIASLYTLIPSLRDDFGNVEIITDDSENDKFNNFYNTKTKTLILNKYKGSDFKGTERIKIPQDLHKIIIESLKKNPRIFLITKNENESYDKIYTQGRLTNLVKQVFRGHSINDIRHSYSSSDFIGKGIDIVKLKSDANSMLHSLPQHLSYLRGVLN